MTYKSSFQDRAAQAAEAKKKALDQYRARPPVDEKLAAERAAFEILTSLPIDWDKAAQCLPQDDEPWRKPRMVEPQMLLTAEAGWVGGDILFGPDKKAELLAEVNQWRAKRGLPEVCWKDDPRAGEEIPADEW